MARVGLGHAQNRLGRRLAGMGTALYGRMFKIALAQGISFRLGIEVLGFIEEDGRVVGLRVRQCGSERRIAPRRAC